MKWYLTLQLYDITQLYRIIRQWSPLPYSQHQQQNLDPSIL